MLSIIRDARTRHSCLVLFMGFFCIAAFGQKIKMPFRSFQPWSSSIISYSEFERTVLESAAKADLKPKSITAIFKDFRESNPAPSQSPQEWRYLLLDHFYQKNIPYKFAEKLFARIPFCPINVGYKDIKQAPDRNAGDEESKSFAGAINFIFDPFITQQKVIPYTEFINLAMKSAASAGIKKKSIESVLQYFGASNLFRVVNSQEWRYSLLDLFYRHDISYKHAAAFFSNFVFHPVDTGFLNEMGAADVNDMDKDAAGAIKAGDPSHGKDIKLPQAVYAPKPLLTDAARKMHVSGTLSINALITKNGTVGALKVVRGLGYGLEESSIRKIKTEWQFKPGLLKDQPVNIRSIIYVSFGVF